MFSWPGRILLVVCPQLCLNPRLPPPAPMNLIENNNPKKIHWDEKHEEVFGELKTCQAPVLFSHDFSLEFILCTDASDICTILSQDFQGEEHPVLYLSRKLSSREKSYSIIEKAALAVKWMVDAHSYYLLGRPFSLIIDHTPLHWIQTTRDMNPYITKWYLAL